MLHNVNENCETKCEIWEIEMKRKCRKAHKSILSKGRGTVIPAVCMAIAMFALTACGGEQTGPAGSSGNAGTGNPANSDAVSSEVDAANKESEEFHNEIYSLERSEGIEKELKELKAEQSKDTDNNKPVSVETETWDDEYVISFVDKKFRKEIIEITGISGRDITYGDVKNIETLSSIENVSIENYKYFTGLKELYVFASYSDNINALANCQNLTSLVINGCDAITDISPLTSCQNLTSLHIDSCDAITDISPLASCQSLTSLRIDRCDAITDITSCQNLTSLYIYSCDAITKITSCQNLTSLVIDSCDAITNITSCQNLTSLAINYCDAITDISPLANCQNLTSLRIDRCDAITDISPLAICQNLTSLVIDGCDAITGISPLASCQSLTSLEIDRCDAITDISPLASCQNLTSLVITVCDAITDISSLANCQNLTSLEIYSCDNVSDEAIRQVKNSLGLE